MGRLAQQSSLIICVAVWPLAATCTGYAQASRTINHWLCTADGRIDNIGALFAPWLSAIFTCFKQRFQLDWEVAWIGAENNEPELGTKRDFYMYNLTFPVECVARVLVSLLGVWGMGACPLEQECPRRVSWSCSGANDLEKQHRPIRRSDSELGWSASDIMCSFDRLDQ